MTDDEKAHLVLSAAVTGVSFPAAPAMPRISFKVSDAKGNGVKGLPVDNLRIGLLKLSPATAATGGNDTWIGYQAADAVSTCSAETATATTLEDLGDGNYTYTLQKNGG